MSVVTFKRSSQHLAVILSLFYPSGLSGWRFPYLLGFILFCGFFEVYALSALDVGFSKGASKFDLAAGLVLFGCSSALKFISFFLLTEWSFKFGAKFAVHVLHNLFSERVQMSSEKFVSLLSFKSDYLVSSVVLPFFQIVQNVVYLVAALIFFSPKITWEAMVGCTLLMCVYIGFLYWVKSRINNYSLSIKGGHEQTSNWARNFFDAKSLVFSDSRQPIFFERIFYDFLLKLRVAQARVSVFSLTPKYILEVSLFLFAGFVVAFESEDYSLDIGSLVLPGLIVVQRVLPAVQQCYGAIILFWAGSASLTDVTKALKKPEPVWKSRQAPGARGFEKVFEGKWKINAGFKRPQDSEVHRKMLQIKAGSWTLIDGPSGSGKTTLLMSLLGLADEYDFVFEQSGTVIDRAEIIDVVSYCPQRPFIIRSSMKENLAFPFNPDDYDLGDYESALSATEGSKILNERRIGLEDLCDETLFSGGEVQRFGISRALVSRPRILVLDESFSAIDQRSSVVIVNQLRSYYQDMAVILVTHDPVLKSMCDETIGV